MIVRNIIHNIPIITETLPEDQSANNNNNNNCNMLI